MDALLTQFMQTSLDAGIDEVYASYSCEILQGNDEAIEEAIEALALENDDAVVVRARLMELYETYLNEKTRAETSSKLETVADLNAKLSQAMLTNQQRRFEATTTRRENEEEEEEEKKKDLTPEEAEMKRIILERIKQQQLNEQQEQLASDAAAEAERIAQSTEAARAKAHAGKDLISKIQAKEAKLREEEKSKRKASKDAQLKDVESKKEKKEERQKRAAKGERKGEGAG